MAIKSMSKQEKTFNHACDVYPFTAQYFMKCNTTVLSYESKAV